MTFAPDDSSISLSDAIGRYFEEVIAIRDRPADYLKKEFARFYRLTKFWKKETLLHNITKGQILNYITALRHTGKSNATINRQLCALSALFNRAKKFWDKNSPQYSVLQFRQKEPPENIKYLKSWNDLQRIIDAAPDHIKPVIYTAIYTGLRLGNILALKWENIDFVNKNITVRVKGDKFHVIPVIAPLMTVFNSMEKVSPYVFTYKGKPVKSIKTAWHKMFMRSGLPYINFHTLRHTAATWIYNKTHDLRVTKEIMGHASIQTTLKYAHLVDGKKREALDAVFTKP